MAFASEESLVELKTALNKFAQVNEMDSSQLFRITVVVGDKDMTLEWDYPPGEKEEAE